MKYNALFLCLVFTGCADVPDDNTDPSTQSNQMTTSVESTYSESSNNGYHGDELIKNVNHYAKWLTQDLFANIDFPNNSDVYVVTNFALLDSDLNKTNHFGRQMTEGMIHEVHNTGFSVIDLKASGFIRMTETGDVFYQSEDHMELSPATDASHIITGTLTKHRGGYFVNAKVILLENKALVSSAQIFVPHEVVDAVMLEEKEVEDKDKKKEAPKKTTMAIKAYSK